MHMHKPLQLFCQCWLISSWIYLALLKSVSWRDQKEPLAGVLALPWCFAPQDGSSWLWAHPQAFGSLPQAWKRTENITPWPANQCLSPAAQMCMDSLDKYGLENVQLPNIKVWTSQAGGKEERVEGVFLKPSGETEVAGGCFLTQMKDPCNMLQSFHLSPFKITIL